MGCCTVLHMIWLEGVALLGVVLSVKGEVCNLGTGYFLFGNKAVNKNRFSLVGTNTLD